MIATASAAINGFAKNASKSDDVMDASAQTTPDQSIPIGESLGGASDALEAGAYRLLQTAVPDTFEP